MENNVDDVSQPLQLALKTYWKKMKQYYINRLRLVQLVVCYINDPINITIK